MRANCSSPLSIRGAAACLLAAASLLATAGPVADGATAPTATAIPSEATVPTATAVTTETATATLQRDPFFSRWETIGTRQGLPSEKVFAVAVDGDKLWAGTEKGLALLEAGAVSVFGTAEGLPFPVVTSLAVSTLTGDLWIGTMGGVARLSGGRIDAFTQLDSGLVNDVVYGVAVDGSDVWIATAAGLSRYDTRTREWDVFDTSNTLMHEPWCYAVTTAGGNVYVAVWGGGVVVREAGSGQFREHRDPDGEMEIDLFRDDGLVHDVTSAVAFAKGTMWVGTYFGLSRYAGRRWRSYSEADSGLAGDFINFLKAEGEVVWIATDQGLSRFDTQTWHTWRRTGGDRFELRVTDPDGKTRSRSLRTGPASNTIYGIDLRRNDIWLATAAGLSHGIAAAEAARFPSPRAQQEGAYR